MAKLLSGRTRSEGLADDNGENSLELPQKGQNIAVILGTKVRYLNLTRFKLSHVTARQPGYRTFHMIPSHHHR